MRIPQLIALLTACFLGAALPAGAADGEQPWQSEHFRDHPLVGKIYSVATKDFVAEADLLDAASQADYVLLGETHTNADHHLLQAAVIKRMVEGGRWPAVFFEMIPTDLSADLAKYLAGGKATAQGLGAVVKWEERGWPKWSIYQAIADVALENGLVMHAGDIDSGLRKRIGKEGLEALGPQDRAQLALDRPLDDALRESLAETLRVSHCGVLPEAAVGAILQVQRARDAALADAMLSASGSSGGVVLIAGRGHARGDYGVPWYLRARRPTSTIFTLGLVEVEPAALEIADYLGDEGENLAAFDFLWFTPKSEIKDHCAELKKRFGKPAVE
jgi:uncharacterized iron-regulated protein